MSCGSNDATGWSRRRWGYTLVLVFALQIGGIFWLGETGPGRPRQPRATPTLHLASEASAEVLALTDPTLLALPHRQGFSGPAWLEVPPPPQRFFEWSEKQKWPSLPTSQLAVASADFLDPQPSRPIPPPSRIPPELTMPDPPRLSLVPTQSQMWVEGGFAGRKLISPPPVLPAWPAGDIPSNTIVRIVIDGAGRPVSPALLAGSGLKVADDEALRVAKTLRFESRLGSGPDRETNPDPRTQLSWECLVFQWLTVPTNTPSGP